MEELKDIRNCIKNAIMEGSGVKISNLVFNNGRYERSLENNMAIDVMEEELVNMGWKEIRPCEMVWHHFCSMDVEKFFDNSNRVATISICNSFELMEKIVVLDILPTIEFMIRKASYSRSEIRITRWDATPDVAGKALIECGWVVTEPSKKIASIYTNLKNAVFFEKGDRFAVTGLQDFYTVYGGKVNSEGTIIINYKNNFDG